MSTDDLVALGGITLGGVAGLALTAALLAGVPKPPAASGVLPSPPVAPTPAGIRMIAKSTTAGCAVR